MVKEWVKLIFHEFEQTIILLIFPHYQNGHVSAEKKIEKLPTGILKVVVSPLS